MLDVTKELRKIADVAQATADFTWESCNNFPPSESGEPCVKPFQMHTIRHIIKGFRNGWGVINCLDTGLGKTRIMALVQLHIVMQGAHRWPMLVVTTVSTKGSWIVELLRWFRDKIIIADLGGGLAKGSRAKEFNNLFVQRGEADTRPLVVMYTYDALARDISLLGRVVFSICVYDEVHILKEYSSARYRAACMLITYFRVLLTATPVHNVPKDFTRLLRLANQEKFGVEEVKRYYNLIGGFSDTDYYDEGKQVSLVQFLIS